MKPLFIIISMLISMVCYAHQPDLSTLILSKTADGKYVLQLNSSLTAFEGEIDYLYAKNAYKTPEEFKKLVISHFEKNVVLVINKNDTLKFANPMVLLGHETRLVVEVLGLPASVSSVYLKCTVFKDIPRNQTIAIMLKAGLPDQQYILNNENHQAIHLSLKGGKWLEIEQKESAYFNNSFGHQMKSFWQFTTAGFKHVLPLGLDHVLFIVALFFLNSNLKSSIVQASMFTLAHSITLIITGLGYIVPNATIIEPVIAFSIFIMALQNIFHTEVDRYRLAMVFIFGLVHGLGFANAFLNLQIPAHFSFNALLAFNIGVELAQIFIIVSLYYLFAKWVSRKNWYPKYFVKAVSVTIALIALIFTFQRL